MTTFGGHTIPPLFVGGGVASAIFLRSTSAFYNKDIDGTPFTVTAPTRVANDQLFFIKAGFGMINPQTPAGWFAFAALPNTAFRLYFRLATNTAADDFAVGLETTARPVVGQMAVFGNTLGETGLLAEYQAGSSINDLAGTTWNLGALGVDATPEANDLVLAYYFRERNFGIVPQVDTISPPVFLANNIGSIAYNQTGGTAGDIWVGWDWEAEASNSPAFPLTAITYSPIIASTTNFSRSQRMRY